MKGKSIIETVLVFVLLLIFSRYRYYLFTEWGLDNQIIKHISNLLTILIPILLIVLPKRDLTKYGLSFKNWKYNLNLGLISYIVQLIPWGLGYALIIILNSSYEDLFGSLILFISYFICIIIMLFIFRKENKTTNKKDNTVLNLFILIIILLLPVVSSFYFKKNIMETMSTTLWYIIFVGYRGYIQSRINEEFGKPFTIFGVKFGYGLIIASFLFSISHILNNYNFFVNQYNLSWWWGLWTFFSGLFFGLLREKTGSILAPAIAHGFPNAIGKALLLIIPITQSL